MRHGALLGPEPSAKGTAGPPRFGLRGGGATATATPSGFAEGIRRLGAPDPGPPHPGPAVGPRGAECRHNPSLRRRPRVGLGCSLDETPLMGARAPEPPHPDAAHRRDTRIGPQARPGKPLAASGSPPPQKKSPSSPRPGTRVPGPPRPWLTGTAASCLPAARGTCDLRPPSGIRVLGPALRHPSPRPGQAPTSRTHAGRRPRIRRDGRVPLACTSHARPAAAFRGPPRSVRRTERHSDAAYTAATAEALSSP